MITVFLDSSVLFSCIRSQTGASALVIALCRQRLIKGYISRHVIAETRKNILLKLNKDRTLHFEKVLVKDYLTLEKDPTPEEIQRAALYIHKKDAIILAAAINIKVHYLLTLDVKHFFQESVRHFAKPVKVAIPGKFIQEHRDIADKLE